MREWQIKERRGRERKWGTIDKERKRRERREEKAKQTTRWIGREGEGVEETKPKEGRVKGIKKGVGNNRMILMTTLVTTKQKGSCNNRNNSNNGNKIMQHS